MTQQVMKVYGDAPDIFDPIQCRRRGRDSSATYIHQIIDGKAEGIKMTLDPEGERRGSFSVDIRNGVNGDYVHRHMGTFKVGPSGLTVVDDPELPEGLWDEDTQTYVADSKSFAKEGQQKYNLAGNYGPVQLQMRLHGRYSGNGVVLTVGYENAVDNSEIAYQARMDGWGFYDVDLICESSEPLEGLQFPYAETESLDSLVPGELVSQYETNGLIISVPPSMGGKSQVEAATAAESLGGTGSALAARYIGVTSLTTHSVGLSLVPDRILSGISTFANHVKMGIKIAKGAVGDVGDHTLAPSTLYARLRLGWTQEACLDFDAALIFGYGPSLFQSMMATWNGSAFVAIPDLLDEIPQTTYRSIAFEKTATGTKLTVAGQEFVNFCVNNVPETITDWCYNRGYYEEGDVLMNYVYGPLTDVNWSDVDGVDCSHIPALMWESSLETFDMFTPPSIDVFANERFLVAGVKTIPAVLVDDVTFELDGTLL